MEDEIDRLVIGVRADTSGFARDVAALKTSLEDSVGGAAERAGRGIESALGRAVRTGKLGFDDLGAVARRVLDQVAAAAIRTGIGSLGAGGGLTGLATTLVTAALGLPGRATGGPVSPGAAYVVGERGPELFVPTSSGRVVAPAAPASAREVKISIAVQAGAGEAPQALSRSSRQVARAVARAIAQAEA